MIKVSEVKAGTKLVADGGFTCMDEGQICEVHQSVYGELYVRCDHGRHFLTYENDGKCYIGFSLFKESVE